MNLITDLYLIEPTWFRGQVDDIWELRHQVSSFYEPLGPNVPFVFTALQALGQLWKISTTVAERVPACDENALEAFKGLAAGEKAKRTAAQLFDCKAPPPRKEQSIHCTSSGETKTVIAMSEILVEHFDEAALGELMSRWATEEAVRALLSTLAGLEPEGKCLVGWTYSSF